MMRFPDSDQYRVSGKDDLYTTHRYFMNQTRSYISPARATAYTSIDRGDVLFPTSGETIEEIGKSAVSLMHTPVVCGGDLIIFRPKIPVEPRPYGLTHWTPPPLRKLRVVPIMGSAASPSHAHL